MLDVIQIGLSCIEVVFVFPAVVSTVAKIISVGQDNCQEKCQYFTVCEQRCNANYDCKLTISG